MLCALGLSQVEEEVYRALLLRDHGDLGAVKAALDVDGEAVSQALDRLVELGFATADPPRLPLPVPPTVAIRALLHRRQAELHARAAELEQLRLAADELATKFVTAVPGTVREPTVEVVVGADEIGRRAMGLIDSATDEVLCLDRPPYASPGPRGAGALDIDGAFDRGVAVRVVFALDGLEVPGRMASISQLVERGLMARVLAALPTKLIVVDRRVALLPPSDHSDPTATALLVGDTLLLNALMPLFEALWDRAAPLGTAPAAPLSADERDLLALLAGGLKDKAIARQLGVHVHTVRRRITRLLTRLDATTRFQAGTQATVRGWLDTQAGSASGPRVR